MSIYPVKHKLVRVIGRFIILVAMAGFTINCSETVSIGPTVNDISWIEGRWMTDDSAYHENWWMTGDSITGEGFTMTRGDTTFREELVITTINNRVVYKALLPSQKVEKVVHFKLTSSQPDSLVFENMMHDFPNRIIYLKKPGDRVSIRVESADGERGFNIDMKKIAE
jgi:hypothetical protein